MVELREWLIRKDGYYYRPDCSGYTKRKVEAGRYTKAEADLECSVEPWHMKAIHQDEVPDEPAIADRDARIAELEAENERFRKEMASLSDKYSDLYIRSRTGAVKVGYSLIRDDLLTRQQKRWLANQAKLTTEPSEPKDQQPVAWRYYRHDGTSFVTVDDYADWQRAYPSREPLYTRPSEQAVPEAMVAVDKVRELEAEARSRTGAVKDMLRTAKELRDNANGDCNAIQQAIYWEQKAAALEPVALNIIAKAIFDRHEKSSNLDVAAFAITNLEAQGFRILGPDEVDQVTLEKAADYIEGAGGVIPATVGFAPLVSGNRQPCMSGDGRDRLHPHLRRDFDDATASLAAAIRAIGRKA